MIGRPGEKRWMGSGGEERSGGSGKHLGVIGEDNDGPAVDMNGK